jgi:fructokinase
MWPMIVSCGEALVDVLPDGRAVPGGGPMNAAITAARLGSPTAFVGRVSTDAHGERIWAHLAASGVLLDGAQRGDEPTARAIVETDPIQRFTFEGDSTADASMTAADLSRLDLGTGPQKDVLHGGTLGIFRGTTADVLAELCRGFDGIVSFDPNVRPAIIEQTGVEQWWRYADTWLERADLVRGSDEDFEWMGLSVPELLERGPRAVIETRGAEGAAVHLRNGPTVTVPAPSIRFVDAVGAGDSFCGAVLTLLDRNGWPPTTVDWEQVLTFAVRVAGITCSRAGADPPWADEI